jgi:uncharacterized membrane protein
MCSLLLVSHTSVYTIITHTLHCCCCCCCCCCCWWYCCCCGDCYKLECTCCKCASTSLLVLYAPSLTLPLWYHDTAAAAAAAGVLLLLLLLLIPLTPLLLYQAAGAQYCFDGVMHTQYAAVVTVYSYSQDRPSCSSLAAMCSTQPNRVLV